MFREVAGMNSSGSNSMNRSGGSFYKSGNSRMYQSAHGSAGEGKFSFPTMTRSMSDTNGSGWLGGDRGESRELVRARSDLTPARQHPRSQPVQAVPTVGRTCTLSDYFSGHGRLRVRPHAFTSTLLLPPLHEKNEATAKRVQTVSRHKVKNAMKALSQDKDQQKIELSKMLQNRRSLDATEPVVRQRLDKLFEHLGLWQPLVPESATFDGSDDPGLYFQLDIPDPDKAPKQSWRDRESAKRMLKLDDQELAVVQKLVQLAHIQAGGRSQSSEGAARSSSKCWVLRSTFCRLLLDLEICDSNTLPFHWCVSLFDAHSSTHVSTPQRFVTPDAFDNVLQIILGQKFTEYTRDNFFLYHLPLVEVEIEQRLRRFNHLAYRYTKCQATRHITDDTRLAADPVLSQMKNMDVTRQFPPLGYSVIEYQALLEKEDSMRTDPPPVASEEEKISDSKTKLSMQLMVLDMVCEPEAIHFMQKFHPLLEGLFAAYHDTSEDRIRDSMPSPDDPPTPNVSPTNRGRRRTSVSTSVPTENPESPKSNATQEARDRLLTDADAASAAESVEEEPQVTGHMSFPQFVQFCSDFQLFPKLAGYAEIRFLYETAVNAQLLPVKKSLVIDESKPKKNRPKPPALMGTQGKNRMAMLSKTEMERTRTEKKALEVLHALCDWMESRIGRVQDVFTLFDTDHNWMITVDEFMAGIDLMRIRPVPTEEEVEDILRVLDTNFDGAISLAELEKAISEMMAYRKEEKLKASMAYKPSLKVTKDVPQQDEAFLKEQEQIGKDALALRYLKLEDNSFQHYPRQIEIPIVNGKPKLEIDTSRPVTPEPLVEKRPSVETPQPKGRKSVAPPRKSVAPRASIVSERRGSAGESVVGETGPKTVKRWRVFGPAAFSETLLRMVVEHLTFHGNPVQSRGSVYSKGIWLLTNLHSVFRDACNQLETAEPPDSSETSFVRPLHGLVWGSEGHALFQRFPKEPCLPQVTEPHITEDELSTDSEPEEELTKRPSADQETEADPAKTVTRGSKGRPPKANKQAAAAAATQAALNQKQIIERKLEQKRRRREEKKVNAKERRLHSTICSLCKRNRGGPRKNYGSAHCWRCSSVDQHPLWGAEGSTPLAKLLRRQSKNHAYLVSVEKWLATMGSAQDYWMTKTSLNPEPEAPPRKAKAKAKAKAKGR